MPALIRHRSIYPCSVALLVASAISIVQPRTLRAAGAREDLAPTGTLRIAFLGRNPAQAIRDPATGEYSGPVPDIMREMSRKLGIPCRLMPEDNAKAVMDAVNGHGADVGFLAYDAERARFVDFSAPLYLMFSAYLVRADGPFRDSADIDRPGVKVGVTTGQTQQIYLSRTLKMATVVLMKETPSEKEMVRLLESGEIDAFGQNRERSEAVAAKQPAVRVLKDNFSDVGQSLVVAKGDKIKLEHLNRMVIEAIKSGVVKTALERAKVAGVGVAPLRQ